MHVVTLSFDDGFERSSRRTAEIFERHGLVAELHVLAAGHRLEPDDEWHRRSFIESCVFRAVAELLGKDPWDIAPERYRHF